MYLNPFSLHLHITLYSCLLRLSVHTLCCKFSFSNVGAIVMQYIRLGEWFCYFRKCWNKGVWGAAVCKPTIFVWHLFCLTVRQYQTHNIQYFAVRDSFPLYHITVFFRANNEGVLWKLSICSFPVMTSHQQLVKIFIFFWCSLRPASSIPG